MENIYLFFMSYIIENIFHKEQTRTKTVLTLNVPFNRTKHRFSYL